jgi:hypothetical protein
VESLAAAHCLDACAVIAYLQNETRGSGSQRDDRGAHDLLGDACLQSQGGLLGLFRSDGLPAVSTAWVTTLRDADDLFMQRVGILKVEERISCADAFALALVLADRPTIPLMTTDHHEFDAVEQKGHLRFRTPRNTDNIVAHRRV